MTFILEQDSRRNYNQHVVGTAVVLSAECICPGGKAEFTVTCLLHGWAASSLVFPGEGLHSMRQPNGGEREGRAIFKGISISFLQRSLTWRARLQSQQYVRRKVSQITRAVKQRPILCQVCSSFLNDCRDCSCCIKLSARVQRAACQIPQAHAITNINSSKLCVTPNAITQRGQLFSLPSPTGTPRVRQS